MGYKIIAIDIDDKILDVAQQAGVDHVFNSRSTPEYLKIIHRITSGGVDAVLVFTAVKAGYDSAPKVLKTGGKIVCVGVPPVDISFSALDISLGKFSVIGASNHASPTMLRECMEFTFANGIECPQQFFNIDQIEEMIELMEKGKMGGTRLVVKF
jgi:propanol-preferring alcohol dehydrogenase